MGNTTNTSVIVSIHQVLRLNTSKIKLYKGYNSFILLQLQGFRNILPTDRDLLNFH